MSKTLKQFWHTVNHWEYWPSWIVYLPMTFPWIYYSLRSGSPFFFNGANPGMANGGFLNVSKMDIYRIIPAQFYPKTHFISEALQRTELPALGELAFPVFVKPDKGLRGRLVQKINDSKELEWYHQEARFDYLIQESIQYPLEAGIFYIRLPNQPLGIITGIVQKYLPTVTGNGQSPVKELMSADPRLSRQLSAFSKSDPDILDQIPKKGESFICAAYGNHCRGATFIDRSDRITEKLTRVMNDLCLQIPGFYYGRLDIKFESWEALESGHDYKIIELNGALSEPAHIYDPRHSFWKGQLEIFKHIHYMYLISKQQQANGIQPLSWLEGFRQMRSHFKTMNLYSMAASKY